MRAGRAIALLMLLAAIAGLAGCNKKKKPPLPPQAQAPSMTSGEPPATASQPAPSAGAEAGRPQPEAAPKETTAAPAPPAPKPKPAPRTRITAKPAKPEPPARVVVPEGGAAPAPSGEILASVPHAEALHQKWNSAQLLEATEANLRTLTRSLTADEQAMVRHIRSYMQQSRDATKDGDGDRAYNLALKAHLLSDELVKH